MGYEAALQKKAAFLYVVAFWNTGHACSSRYQPFFVIKRPYQVVADKFYHLTDNLL
jgi:hypothetical protein